MKTNQLAITIYPNAFGMGYVISETPKELINYGIAKIRPLTKDKYIKRLLKYIEYYKPKLILLRGYTDTDKRISKRVIKVINEFEKQAEGLDLPIYKYSRDDIKQVFDQFEGSTKYSISKTITSWYPELKRFMPDIRVYPNTEHYRMGVFDAFALMLTHHYLE